MKTYQFKKEDCTLWMFFYDTNIQYWTVMEVDIEGNQISREADYYSNKKQMIDVHGFNFKTVIS